MRIFFYFFVFCNVICSLMAYDIRDFEAIRENIVRSIASLENILEHRILSTSLKHHNIPKSRRIGGNIVLG